MNLWNLVTREIRFRKAGFAMGLVSIVVAIGCLAGAVTLLRAHDIRSERILAERERETREEMARMEDDYRRIMRDLGHNVLILHEEQDLSRLTALGHPDTTMPLEYAFQLGSDGGGSETLNHLLPVLQQRVVWPEHDLEILLSGTPGQVPVQHRDRFLTDDGTAYRNPIIRTLPEGAVRVGHGVAQRLGIRPGDNVTLNGQEFVVERVLPGEGNVDDIAVWTDLDFAHEWLDQEGHNMEGKINGILALECICEPDALGRVTADVQSILPNVQVIEFSSRVKTRALARMRAEEAHRKAIDAEMEHQATMRHERGMFAAVLAPTALAGAGIWVFFLVLANVRERRTEIGILRALGVCEKTIMGVFLLKAAAMGLAGAVVGYFAGVAVGAAWGGVGPGAEGFAGLFGPGLFVAALLIAPALCAAAAWLPAMRAARQDPAAVLRDL